MIANPKSKLRQAKSKENNETSNVAIEKAVEKKVSSNAQESEISVITKTTNPKVLIQSEAFSDNLCTKHQLLRFICMIVMCMIILITFFVSIKTYNLVQELSNYII